MKISIERMESLLIEARPPRQRDIVKRVFDKIKQASDTPTKIRLTIDHLGLFYAQKMFDLSKYPEFEI